MACITIPSHRFRTLKRSHLPILSAIGGFLVWSLLSVLWSPNKSLALSEFSKILPIIFGLISLFCYFKTLSIFHAKKIIFSFLGGVLITTYFMLLDNFCGFKLQQWKHLHPAKVYSYGVISLIFGLGLGLSVLKRDKINWSYQWLWIPAYGLLFAFSRLYDYDAGPIALLMGGLAFLATLLLPRFVPSLIRYGLVLALFLSPILISITLTPPVWEKIVDHEMEHTHRQRLELLEWGNNFIKEKPILGHGFGQTKYFGQIDSHQKVPLPRDYGENFKLVMQENFKGEWGMAVWHMHNGFMQVWVELGLVGIIFLAAFMWFGLKEMESFQLMAYQKATFYGFLFSFLLIFCISFGIWQTWWFSTIGFSFLLYHLNFRVLEEKNKQ